MSANQTNDGLFEIAIAVPALSENLIPLFVAEERGFCTLRGVEIRFHETRSVPLVTELVRDGKADIGIGALEGVVQDCVAGGPLRIVAGNLNAAPLSLVAHPSIESVEQLRGKRLGTSSLTEGTALYTREILRAHGLSYPDDYSFEMAGAHPQRWQALQEGRIDAALQLVPLNFVAQEQGWNLLAEASEFFPSLAFSGLVARTDWMAENQSALLSLLMAVVEGTRWCLDPANENAVVDIVLDRLRVERPILLRSLALLFKPNVLAPDAEFKLPGLEVVCNTMERYELLEPGQRKEALSTYAADYHTMALQGLRA